MMIGIIYLLVLIFSRNLRKLIREVNFKEMNQVDQIGEIEEELLVIIRDQNTVRVDQVYFLQIYVINYEYL